MRIFLSFLTLLFFILGAHSQAIVSNDGGVFYINKNQKSNTNLNGKRGGFHGKHHLGDTVGLAFDKFLKYYVKYESTGGAYAAEKKVIYKENIYNSVIKLDKYFKKEIRANKIPKEEAKERLGIVLNTAIAIRFYDTTDFERMLSVTKDLERKEYFFNNIKYREWKFITSLLKKASLKIFLLSLEYISSYFLF